MSKRKPPEAHTWADGGGMVVRCEDPEVARPLLVAAYLENQDWWDEEEWAQHEAELFPAAKSRIERGRMLGALPGSAVEAEGWSWAWYPHSAGQSERGTTVAVVWSSDR